MKVLHVLAAGGTGGIETLVKDYGEYSKCENIFVFPWNGGNLAECMRMANLNVFEIHSGKTDLYKVWRALCYICENEHVDAVVEHHSAPFLLLEMTFLKKKYCKIKTVAYAHCNAENMRGGSGNRFLALRRWLIQKSLQRADTVVAISHSVKDSLVQRYRVSADKIEVIYNGVDVKRMAACPHEHHEPAEIVYVGRLIEDKGVQVILKALSHLPSDAPWHFSIVGDGSYREELEKMTRELNLHNRVRFLGTCRNIPEILAKSDVFVHAPIWEEGFGITIVEAMAAGLLCICAKSGAIPEIIQDGMDGFLFEKGNSAELAGALQKCIREYDTDEMMRIRAAAVEKAKHFSIEAFAEQLDGLLGGKKR